MNHTLKLIYKLIVYMGVLYIGFLVTGYLIADLFGVAFAVRLAWIHADTPHKINYIFQLGVEGSLAILTWIIISLLGWWWFKDEV
ncbi:MAG: hypothetical protein GSR79_05070 [Desulfurococcales archaeon]|nr:hypothetical protein [Desulfurococcales archaeon]